MAKDVPVPIICDYEAALAIKPLLVIALMGHSEIVDGWKSAPCDNVGSLI
jgi:hypothetical protein